MTADGNQNTPQESGTYQRMLEEVEGIVREVSLPELDLDLLVQKVERGYVLIKDMRARLETTRDRLEQLKTEFE